MIKCINGLLLTDTHFLLWISLCASGGRVAAVQLPLGQLVTIGVGALCVMNPEKFFLLLQRTTQAFLLPQPSSHGHSQQPIVIHQTTAAAQASGRATVVAQVLFGATVCWGTYVVAIQLLPEQFKGMLPVSTSTFKTAVSSLGKAVINLKETLMEQISGLSKKQDELGEQQEETHSEVLNVKESVTDLKEDLTLIQESLNLCHSTLSESDKRTAYIAQGVQLLTRGVSTFLPEDDALMKELLRFNVQGEQFKMNPAQLQQMRQLMIQLQKHKSSTPTLQQAVLLTDNDSVGSSNCAQTKEKSAVDNSVAGVQTLLTSLGVM